MPETKHPTVENRPNFAEVSIEGLRVEIGYGNHNQVQSTEFISADTQAVVIETAPNDYAKRPETLANAYAMGYQGERQYIRVLETMQERGLPLVFLDVTYKPGAEISFRAELLAECAKTGLGMTLVKDLHREVTSGRKMGRREALKLMIKGAAGAYLSMGTLPKILNALACQTGIAEKESRELVKLGEKANPLSITFAHQVRNVIMAEKLAWLGENTDLDIVALSIGGAHAGIETALQVSSKERIRFLRTLKPAILTLLEKESLYKIAKLQAGDNSRWTLEKFIEVPTLKELFEEKI